MSGRSTVISDDGIVEEWTAGGWSFRIPAEPAPGGGRIAADADGWQPVQREGTRSAVARDVVASIRKLFRGVNDHHRTEILDRHSQRHDRADGGKGTDHRAEVRARHGVSDADAEEYARQLINRYSTSTKPTRR